MKPDAQLSHRDELHALAALCTDAQRSTDLANGARRRLLALDADASPSMGALFEARDLRRALPMLEQSERESHAAIDLWQRATVGAWPGIRPATEAIA